jgi:hypothetical protein
MIENPVTALVGPENVAVEMAMLHLCQIIPAHFMCRPCTIRRSRRPYTSRHVGPTAARRGGFPCKALPRPERLGLVMK